MNKWTRQKSPCADPGVVSGSPDPSNRKSSDNLELGILQFYSGGPMVYFKENYCFPRYQRGSIVFQRGLNFSGMGIKMLISIETYITYDFPGAGGPDLIPSLDPRMHSFFRV